MLLSIVAHARAGALGRARAMFAEAGLERIDDDPAVLSVKGRLLKDEALAARGRERKRLYRESARAYARAAEIDGASYPLINAATLSLLAGERNQSQTLARRVLAIKNESWETAYWRAATRAEAELLLGDSEAAKRSLGDAVGRAPQAYEDHASTLRQFGLILDALHGNKQWLDAFRPPRCLHFAGHMALSPGRAALEREIRKQVADERIGFGYGALAAGADIVIAEALLEAGAELHLVLPSAVKAFRAASVASSGGAWARRFDDIVERASSIRSVANEIGPLSPLAIRLAAEVAMGCAAMQADILQTEALQLLLLQRRTESVPSASGVIARTWRESGRRQHILVAPRRGGSRVTTSKRADRPERLAAVLRIESSQRDRELFARHSLPLAARVLRNRRDAIGPPRWTGDAIVAAYATPRVAAETALALAAAGGDSATLRIAADYGIVRLAKDPFGGAPVLLGAAASRPAEILLSTPDSAIHASETFAAALCAGSAAGRPRAEYVGDLPSGEPANSIRLFSLCR